MLRLRELLICLSACLLELPCVPAAEIRDSATLIRAINEGTEDELIEVPAGTFEIGSPLHPRTGMRIVGAGIGKTVVVPRATWRPGTDSLPKKDDPEAYLFNMHETSRIQLSNMTLRGPSLHGAIYCERASDIDLVNLHIENFQWSSVRTIRTSKLQVHDCDFVDAGDRHGWNGGALYMHFVTDSEFWNNRITKSPDSPRKFFGFKGYKAKRCRFHHNTVEVSFSLEFPFVNDESVEIDHNAFRGTISIPKHAGGRVIEEGYSFHIHHNWLRRSYALEWARNSAIVDHNFFDFDADDDGGNLITDHGGVVASGPTLFHNNQIRNPGRGIFWSRGGYNNLTFRNNHVIVDGLTRKEGLFGLNPQRTDFSTIAIADNIVECHPRNPRPLMRSAAGRRADITNNRFVNISDRNEVANPPQKRPQGLTKPLKFRCGKSEEFEIDGWTSRRVSSKDVELPR